LELALFWCRVQRRIVEACAVSCEQLLGQLHERPPL
jgi:hypothetical protein